MRNGRAEFWEMTSRWFLAALQHQEWLVFPPTGSWKWMFTKTCLRSLRAFCEAKQHRVFARLPNVGSTKRLPLSRLLFLIHLIRGLRPALSTSRETPRQQFTADRNR